MQRILVVERDKLIQQLLYYALRRMNYDPLITYDGHLASTTLAQDQLIALAILNNVTPHSHELKLLQHIRVVYPRLPVLVMSTQPEYFKDAFENGATHCMLKPFRMQDFDQVVQTLLQ
jgi:DNA-binding response OmpR family regulator